jgi:putative ABC transport system permease protein
MVTVLIIAGVLLALPLIVLVILLPFYVSTGATEVTARAVSWVAEGSGAFGLTGKYAAFVLGAPKFAVMMFKNMRRNLLSTSLTFLAIFAGVFVAVMIWSVLAFLDAAMAERAQDVKVIVTEKFQIPSQMPPSYEAGLAAEATSLSPGLAANPKKDLMLWSFVGAATDLTKRSRETDIFFFTQEPATILTMMDGLDENTIGRAGRAEIVDLVYKMQSNIQSVLIGQKKLEAINKKVGDRIKVYCFNYTDITFDLEIIGTMPRGRYDFNAFLNIDYLRRSFDAYERAHGKRHDMIDKSLNLYWARFPVKEGYEQYAERVGQPGRFSSPALKVEMASAAISSFLDAYKSILWGMRYLMGPAILGVIVLVVAISYSISVRQRQKEMAIMKVLGFAPWQILVLVLGEAILVGGLSGAISSTMAWGVINLILGGFSMPIAFFGRFLVANGALWWGPTVGIAASAAGSFLPAWSARKVRVTEVFSRVA